MRTDIAERLFTVSDLLTADECTAFIQRGESIGFEAASVSTKGGPKMLPGVRNNDRATFDDPALADSFWQRIAPFVPPTIDGGSPGFRFDRPGLARAPRNCRPALQRKLNSEKILRMTDCK